MVVLILEKATKSIRGKVSRWMLEPRTGVFIGGNNMTAAVREQIWQLVRRSRVGAAFIVYPKQNESGYWMENHKDPTRQIIDVDGLQLIRIPPFKAAFDKATKGAVDA